MRSTDGAVTLQAALYTPDAAVFGAGPYPTVVSCYGGPHAYWLKAPSIASAGFPGQPPWTI